MSDFYDQEQDIEPAKSDRRYLRYALVLLVASSVWGFTTGFMNRWNGDKPPADVSEAAYRSQSINWESCAADVLLPSEQRDNNFSADSAVCGTFKVPASYSSKFGRDLPDLTIQVLKSPALDQKNKLGTLFFNPGGPGGSGIDVVQNIVVPDEIRAKYDLVGFDPRGVGKSSPVVCDDNDSIDYYFKTVSSPENEAEGQANDAWVRDSVEKCAKKNPNWWVMTTLNTVRDMDIMREVLTGDEKFNFVGFSYGTTLAVEYIRAFPEHAGRIVLDSVTANDSVELSQAQRESTYKALKALFEKCADDPKCPGGSVQEVQDIIFKSRDLANEGKLSGSAITLSSNLSSDSSSPTDDELLYDGIFALSYGSTDSSYEYFVEDMNKLVSGDAWYFETEALTLNGWYVDGEYWVRDNSADILDIVNCMDIDSRDLRSTESKTEDQKLNAQADPFTSKYFASDSGYVYASERGGCEWSWLAFDDPKIPDPPRVMETPVNESGQRFLLIGSNLDTVTPIENAKNVAELLDSELLIYEGSGHAQSFGGIKCIDDAISKYLVEGYLPSRAISCPVE